MNSCMEISRRVGIFEPTYGKVAVRSEFGMVVMFIGDAKLVFGTTLAHEVGYKLCIMARNDLDLPHGVSNDIITMNINGKMLDLLPRQAQSIGVALLRKADDADDFQLENGKVRVVT